VVRQGQGSDALYIIRPLAKLIQPRERAF